jgi:hypothetical protein
MLYGEEATVGGIRETRGGEPPVIHVHVDNRPGIGCGGWTALGCLGLVGLFLVLAIVGTIRGLGEARDAAKERASREKPAGPVAHLGDTVTVGRPGEGRCFLAVDEDAWKAMVEAQVDRDVRRLNRMIADERVFSVKAGNRATLLSLGVFSRKVRMLEGQHPDKAGWIQSEFVHLAAPADPLPTPAEPSSVPARDPAADVPAPEAEHAGPSASPKAEPAPPVAPESPKRAASLLGIAKALEKVSKRKEALDTYRQIVKEFPASKEADQARGRIEALDPEE